MEMGWARTPGWSRFANYGHPLTSCRVRAMDRAATRNSKENGNGADGSSSKHPQARALDFLLTEVICESFSDARLYDIENECFLHIFLMFTTGIKLNGFHLKFTECYSKPWDHAR